MNSTRQPSSYQACIGTVLTVFFVGVAWTGNSFPFTVERFWPNGRVEGAEWVVFDGWPFICIRRGVYDIPALVADVVIGSACLLSVAYSVDKASRSRLQFSVSSVLVLIAVVGALCAFWEWDARQFSEEEFWDVGPGLDDVYAPLQRFSKWYLIIPVGFSLGRLFYVLLMFACRAAALVAATTGLRRARQGVEHRS